MSVQPHKDPVCQEKKRDSAIELIIDARALSLGAFSVRRLLPAAERRMVGPFIFFDHIGPAQLAEGVGIDVRPHPHINLATVTYLFEGDLEHRDSLGSHQVITPHAINWMTAGSGIVHSERSSNASRVGPSLIHGIQLWVALPTDFEETPASFHHHPADTLPEIEINGASIRVLLGEAFDCRSPVETFSPLFYVDARMPKDAKIDVPMTYSERAMYVVEGKIQVGTESVEPGCMLIFSSGMPVTLHAEENSRLVLLGGEALRGERHIWWNFVSSSKERIEQAKRDWQEGRFGKVPGDEEEFIPLPEN